MKYLIFIILLLFIINPHSDVSSVYNDTNYDMYVLEFPYYNISTSNIDIFEDIQIIWIEPLVNKLYHISYRYYFEDVRFKENIERFKEYYFYKLSYYKNDIAIAKVSGIKINRMMVYSSKEKISKLNIKGLVIN